MNKINVIVQDFDGKTSRTIVPVKDTDLKKLKKMFMGMDVTHEGTVVGKIIDVEVVK